MKKFLVILVIVLLLGGGGVAGWLYMTNRLNPAEAGIPALPHLPPSAPVYVDFRPMQLPVIGDDRIEQMITIKIVIEVADRDAGDRVIAMAPRLTDAFMLALYGTLRTNAILQPNGMVDVGRLKARIVEVSRRVMGEGVVNDALVQTIAQRQL